MAAKENTLKLSPALKARWVKALRSGKYKQAQGSLRDDTLKDVDGSTYTGFCCLGVLCAISKPVREQVSHWETNELLNDVDEAPVVLSGEIQYRLSSKNDSGDSFKKIACYIERSKSI